MAGQSDGWITTARLLRRTGFGVTGAQVDAVAKQNWPAYVDAALRADPAADPGAIATPMPTLPTLRGPGKGASMSERKEFRQRANEQLTELSRLVVTPDGRRSRADAREADLAVAQPLRDLGRKGTVRRRMGHKTRSSAPQARRLPHPCLCDADRRRDAAWLDAQSNTAKAPTRISRASSWSCSRSGTPTATPRRTSAEGARALTGWGIGPATGQAMLVPKRHDRTPRRSSASPGISTRRLLRRRAEPAAVGGVRCWQAVAATGF